MYAAGQTQTRTAESLRLQSGNVPRVLKHSLGGLEGV